MEKQPRSISVMLMVALLIISSVSITTVKIMEYRAESSDDLDSDIWQFTPLTNTQIMEKWPNLPSAEQIYEEGSGAIIDLGHPASGWNLASIINCTTAIPDYMHGGLILDAPLIYLQYNSTIWVQVPPYYLNFTYP